MDKFIVMGGNEIKGEISLQAAKNAVLPLLSCSILCKEDIVLKNCPKIADIVKMMSIIEKMGGKAEFEGDDIHLNCKAADCKIIDSELTKSIRSSVFMLGSLLGRYRKAEISHPGGCAIGKRPIDIHIDGLRALGVSVEETESYIKCDGKNLKGGIVNLSFPSVGATENIMMASVCARGKTVINGAAREPEIVDLQRFINAIGGKVSGAGTGHIIIEGVEKLHGCTFTPISDRIAAGTYAVMCAMCGGDLSIKNCDFKGVRLIAEQLRNCGCDVELSDNFMRLKSNAKLKALPLIATRPFPDFPTDMQPQFCAMLTVADGVSVIEENVFENRFKYTEQLRRMGADIVVEGHRATVKGVKELQADKLTSEDLRGGAAVVAAALRAKGVSEVYGVEHIDRGYFHIEKVLTDVGADIVRVKGKDMDFC